ncbi:hypothetical protein K432DRAFT_364557 [Lepidopterella palustris CBS 459.81]|uniref:Uncharacterized protein n=1 Tax=Lepidopterella palustris CBS 459.81 TaxID=1314670 RepID=A0A8E2DXP6_9PEZI|nr:hypothetical protein K432DRAFT_364557 [Lepidopterella palustris CBS 459.81]
MANPKIAKHYARLISLWPKDALRPTVSFQSTLQYRASQFSPAPTTATSSSPNASSNPSPSPSPAPASLSKPDPKAELLNINALYSLLENRYSKRYPISPRLLRPTSNPTYYDDLIAELEAAPTRSWFARKMEGWKRMIRFS